MSDSSHIHGIVKATGHYGQDWPQFHNLPQGKSGSFSHAGWTKGNEGFPQQTFLGASIRSFNLNAGFGDTTSTLSVELVNDEYNLSDGTPLGTGVDVYHNGGRDQFTPPVVGTPVYFTFGGNPASVDQAFRKTFDDTYPIYGGTMSIPANWPPTVTASLDTQLPYHFLVSKNATGNDGTWEDRSALWNPATKWRGKDHFVFGGILQSYTQNRSPAGNPLYSVQVTDPREILTNAVILLNNYQGSTFNNKNLINVYGFLEYDLTDGVRACLDGNAMGKSILTKGVDAFGNVAYVGNDMYYLGPDGSPGRLCNVSSTLNELPEYFPVTGQGFSRRSDKGIPWYRIEQALVALFQYNGALPLEYITAGFGGAIDFRGYKYVVDFSGLPTEHIPPMYFMDFDQMNLLELAQEICDITSHDLFVSLLPVIDHPACNFINHWNASMAVSNPSEVIAGIIRVDAIDKSKPPKYGAIKSYLDTLSARGVDVESQDLGYELSNVTTDKFVVGAQEVEMYYFSNNKDRDNLELRKKNSGKPNSYELLQADKWRLSTSLKQQILPFYGFLGADKAVTIPKGFGAYQQIMLDATSLNAYGVGNYYIATEMELRAALVSYERWRDFLVQYDEVYMQELSENQTWDAALVAAGNGLTADAESAIDGLSGNAEAKAALKEMFAGRDFGVSVPRCLFNSDKDYMGPDGYPASPCSPPYGYPLYYKRAEKIGIPEGGIAAIQSAVTSCMSNVERLKKKLDNNAPEFKILKDDAMEEVKRLEKALARTRTLLTGVMGADEREKLMQLQSETTNALNEAKGYSEGLDLALASVQLSDKVELQEIKSTLNANMGLVKNMSRMAKEHLKNAKKVYNFVKNVAEENLGKKFLVKIPNSCNVNYDSNISLFSPAKVGNVERGPFGFKPMPVSSNLSFAGSAMFGAELSVLQNQVLSNNVYEHYLDNSHPSKYTYGALKGSFNPISEKWEFNYKPEPQGGFLNFALYDRNLSFAEASNVPNANLPLASQSLLTPMDLTNLLNDGNRVSCYARYDHSQNLDFSNVDSKSIAQQSITPKGFIPDVMEELDNLHPDRKMSMQQVQAKLADDKLLKRQGPSVAYVKCDVGEELYMAPVVSEVPTRVWARDFNVKISKPKVRIEFTKDENGCKIAKRVTEKLQPSFAPANRKKKTVQNEDFARYYDRNLKGNIVNSRVDNLDASHVYALITLPGRIKPTVDMRYLDGPLVAFNTVNTYNLMTRDVVRGVPGFDKPAPIVNSDTPMHVDKVTKVEFEDLGEARRLQKQAMRGASLDASKLSFISPSPVYPSMVAMPLMSMERCYGPWLSATSLDPNTGSPGVMNIGGKIEFVKDENLAPWNFAGYQLMNEAGSLQAQFSNSLLLFSERGGFVFPQAPTGISLAKALKKGGPLVTSISVDIGTDKISTAVKMDLYTSSFGKLQKQKEGNIATISRERQKIIDQNNSAIRRGLGKSSSNANLFGSVLAAGGAELLARTKSTDEHFSTLEKGEAARLDYLVGYKERYDHGVPVGGTQPVESSAVTGGGATGPDIQEDNSVEADAGILDHIINGGKMAIRLIGNLNDAHESLAQWASHDPNDPDLPSPKPPKPKPE